MNNLLTALIIVLSINALLMISSNAIPEINPEGTFPYSGGGILENHSVTTANPRADLPTGSGVIQSDSGNFFTDTFGVILNWISDKTGFDSVIKTLDAPYSWLMILGFDATLANIIGTIWYLVTFLLLVLVLTGRN